MRAGDRQRRDRGRSKRQGLNATPETTAHSCLIARRCLARPGDERITTAATSRRFGALSTPQVSAESDRLRPRRAGTHAKLHEWIELKRRWLVSGLFSMRRFDRSHPASSSCCIRTSPSAVSRAGGGLARQYSPRCPARPAPTNRRRFVTCMRTRSPMPSCSSCMSPFEPVVPWAGHRCGWSTLAVCESAGTKARRCLPNDRR